MTRPIDLSALEPGAARRERLVASILQRASPELARRAEAVGAIVVLARWARPALAAAALLAAICAGVLTRYSGLPEMPPTAGVTEALQVPAPADVWILGDRQPTVADLIVAIEEE